MGSPESFMSVLLITLTLQAVCYSDADLKTVGENAYNFTCDLSPDVHDNILQKAINQLQKGNLLNFLRMRLRNKL